MVTYKFGPMNTGAPVRITDAEGETVDEGTTGADGYYTVALDPGRYLATTDPDRVNGQTSAPGTPVPSDGDVQTYSTAAGGIVPSASGSTQTVRLLGPFRVTADDLDPYTDQGVLVSDGADIPTGAVIINTWAEMVTAFTSGLMTTMSLSILTLDPADQESYAFAKTYDILGNQWGNSYVGVEVTKPEDRTAVELPMRITGAPRELRVSLYVEGGTPTTGSIDVFALIAEPA